jgi:hypothetical protein
MTHVRSIKGRPRFFERAPVLGLDFPNGLCGFGGVFAMRRITSSRRRAISLSVKSDRGFKTKDP